MLKDKDRNALTAEADESAHIQVMVTPAGPCCARAVRTSCKLAMVSPRITSDRVEVSESAHLGIKHSVPGVAPMFINEMENLIGSHPETEAVKVVLKTIGEQAPCG